MTELLRSNFEEKLPGLIEKIKSCHFISFDGEFSSLECSNENASVYFDFPPERYTKMWRAAQKALIIQFGFSLVTYRGGKNYEVETFVAYTLPYPVDYLKNKNADFDKYTVEFSEGSEEFLTKYNFDFDKLYSNWIPCLNNKSLKELEDYAAERPQEFMERIKNIKGDFGDASITRETVCEYISRAKGFSKLIQAIGDSKKPFIGHNIICDLIFAYNMFVAPAPESYEEFKKVIHDAFPMTFDTKAIASRLYKIFDNKSLKLKPERGLVHRTGLYTLYKNLEKIVDKLVPAFTLNQTIAARYSKGLEEVKKMENPSINCHEAGFDSLLTGIIYLKLAHVALRICQTFLTRTTPPTYEEYFLEIEHYSNYVYLHRATISEINLKGVDKKACCPEWLRITLPYFVEPSASTSTSGAIAEVQKDEKSGVHDANVDLELKLFREKLNVAEIYSALYDIKRLEPEVINGQLRSVILMSFAHKSCVTKTFNYLAKQKDVSSRRVNFKGETMLKHILEASAPQPQRR